MNRKGIENFIDDIKANPYNNTASTRILEAFDTLTAEVERLCEELEGIRKFTLYTNLSELEQRAKTAEAWLDKITDVYNTIENASSRYLALLNTIHDYIESTTNSDRIMERPTE